MALQATDTIHLIITNENIFIYEKWQFVRSINYDFSHTDDPLTRPCRLRWQGGAA